jgi:hypothetical protein
LNSLKAGIREKGPMKSVKGKEKRVKGKVGEGRDQVKRDVR